MRNTYASAFSQEQIDLEERASAGERTCSQPPSLQQAGWVLSLLSDQRHAVE
jgi:hypothetical protein